MEKKNANFKKVLVLIIFTLVGLWIINNLNVVGNIFSNLFDIVFPFILGGALAFLLNIPMSFFERKCKEIKNKKLLRVLSLIFAVIVILLVIALVAILIVPELVDVVKLLIDNIPYYTEQLGNLIANFDMDIYEISTTNINPETLKEQIMAYIPGLLTSSVSIISNVVKSISHFFIAIIFTFYVLIDKEKIQRQVTKLINAYFSEKMANSLMNIGSEVNRVFKKFFTVQCLEATILGTLCVVGMLILKIPYAVPIGVLVGVTALIPVVGAFVGIIIGAILIASVNPVKVITFIIFVLILQQIEGNLIYPRVVGGSVGLPGMWVLVAVTVGGSLGGIVGMLIGVPMATTIYNLLKIDTDKKIKMKNERKADNSIRESMK